jgi:hypothetical protein
MKAKSEKFLERMERKVIFGGGRVVLYLYQNIDLWMRRKM